MPKIKVSDQLAVDRIMQRIGHEKNISNPAPTRAQVAMVLHALADRTTIMSALKYQSDPTSPWPEATSIGRWLHDVGYELLEFVDVKKHLSEEDSNAKRN